MKIAIAYVIYGLLLNAIAFILWVHIIGERKLTNLNLTLILIFGIFTTMVFAEIAFKDKKNGRDKNRV